LNFNGVIQKLEWHSVERKPPPGPTVTFNSVNQWFYCILFL